MVGIYKIINLKTNECYVGKSKHIEKRWKQHFSKGYGAIHNPKFQEAIEQYGKNGFSFQVVEECAEQVLSERERYWISALKPAYNTVTVGHKVKEETRLKISMSLFGKKPSREIVEKRRKAILERHKTIPQTNAGHKKRVAIQFDGESREFESVKALAEFLGVKNGTVTKALKRNGTVKGKKVWYVV